MRSLVENQYKVKLERFSEMISEEKAFIHSFIHSINVDWVFPMFRVLLGTGDTPEQERRGPCPHKTNQETKCKNKIIPDPSH